ncbi:DUF1574 domain-containing protein [Nodosilinea sp. PGN35]|uniref:hypothetical protein n=1 Tax=Nodosilinea sp. PGN35 TaxID=3020489 RepID=UPI0023B24161|nr:hypothetical protein [Nodosilinea sp. TSF1-S3]MDF0368239.1 hypothetical protein [Nodosilinea sp. TSF1-S3]
MPVSLPNPTLSPNSPAATVLGWLKQAMGLPTAELHIKLRGNILHVLCETPTALDQSAVLLKLVRSLIEGGDHLVGQHYPQVYQLYVYSRLEGNPTPDWTAPIYLNRLERHLAQLVLENQDEADIRATQSLLEQYNQGQSALGGEGGSGAIVMSNLSLARKGDPEAIAWYLSETLSTLDVGVWVSIKAIPGTAHLHRMAIPVGIASRLADDGHGEGGEVPDGEGAGTDTTISRLWILCEATYSPDPSLIARPTAERLRQLQLTQFKDAVLLLQVRGETKPDWSLRIDLTPPEEMLREWGRWGDTDAIARLLSAAVASWHLGVTAELTNGTLHLICSPQSGDHDTQQAEGLEAKEAVLEALATPLTDLAPQGIPRAVIYGQAGADATPAWVHYLDLPAAEHSALADPPEYLGQTGDLPAIAFLLTRLLNPSLDDRLATGGQRVQLLLRDGLLHVMVDGPVAPRRRLVAPPINQYLLALSPMGIEGVRIYGRRSGQSQPAWTFGQDFLTRRRLVPEATPEFTASDSYVNELLVRPDAPVTAADFDDDDDMALGQWVQDVLTQGRQWLLRSQLLTSATPENLGDSVESLADLGRSDGLKIAVVWAAVGVLVALQLDWLLGQIVTPPSQQAKAEDIALPVAPPPRDPLADDLAQLDWPGSQNRDSGWGEGGFTSDSTNGDGINGDGGSQALATSPSQPIVAIDALVNQAAFSSFNSDQMNEKLALYYQRLEQSGPPDVMIVGSSRALRGVDPVALRRELAAIGYEGVSVFNFGINGATAQVVDLVIRQVLEPDQLPRLIIWADGARAFNSGRVDATYNAIAASPGYREVANRRAQEVEVVATPDDDAVGSPATPAGSLPNSYAAMDEWLSDRLSNISAVHADRDRLKGWFQQRLMAATPSAPNASPEALDAAMPEGSTIDFDGFLALSVRFNPATYYQDFARVSGRYDGDYDSFRLEGQQVDAFATLLDFTQAQGIPIVFINTPLTDEYLDDYRRDAEAEFLQHMLRLSTSETGFLFRDFAQLWPNRYDYFSDPSHLNRYGAYQVSSQLGQDPLISWPRPAAPPAPPAIP